MVCYSPFTLDRPGSSAVASMLDLTHILLFVSPLSPLVLLGQTWRRGGLYRAWRLASFAVLLVNVVAWLVNPETAGFVGAGAWGALLVLPAIGLRKAAELASRQRFDPASRLSRSLRVLHPPAALREPAELFRAMTIAQQGDISSALALLAPLRNNQTNVGRQAIAQSFRLRGEWARIVEWARNELAPAARQNDFALLPLYLRALGETGEPDELVLEFAALVVAANPVQLPAWSYHASLRMVLAFCGRMPALAKHRSFSGLPQVLRDFLLGTAELTAGEIPAGNTRLE